MAKRGAAKHFASKGHGLDPAVVKEWLVVKDSHTLKNKGKLANRVSNSYVDADQGSAPESDGEHAAAALPALPAAANAAPQ